MSETTAADSPLGDPAETEAGHAAGPLVLAVPASSFDLLEGAAESRDRVRLLNYGLVILLVLVFATLLSRGVLTRIETVSTNTAAEEFDARSAEVRAELDARRRAGEVSGPAVSGYLDELFKGAQAATGTEIDYPRIIAEVTDLPGVTITDVTFTAAGAEAPPAGVTTTTVGALSSAPAAPTNSAPTAVAGTVVTVTGAAPTTAAANAAMAVLSDPAAFPYLAAGSPGKVTCATNAGPDSPPCTWTWNGTLNDQAAVDRSDVFGPAFGERGN